MLFEGLLEEEEERTKQWRLELSKDDDVGISEDEVRRAVSRLKGGKAPGVCGIRPEVLKAGGEVTIQWLVSLFNMVWEKGVDWRDAIIVPVHKKGNRLECTNYRGISLMSVVDIGFCKGTKQ